MSKEREILATVNRLWATATANGMVEIRETLDKAEKEIYAVIKKQEVAAMAQSVLDRKKGKN